MTIALPWLAPILASLVANGERMPHALLLHGQRGVGKRVLGRALARTLLCESADAGSRTVGGCGRCAACLWFDRGNHPDFRTVTSEAVAAAEGADAPDPLTDEAADGDDGAPASRSKRAPSRDIKVDQVRALHAFLSVATHRNGFRVVLLYPLEALNDVAANALLKMLEEPPPQTVFVLVADRLGRVPVTVVSRCRKVFVATPPAAEAAAWLATRQVVEPEVPLALSGGAPLAALELAGDADAMASHRELVAFLAEPGIEAALATAESFGRSPAAPLIHWLQLWIADCISMRLTSGIRYHPAQSATIERLVGGARPDALLDLGRRLHSIRRSADHPLNTRLMLESLLMAYCDALASGRFADRASTPVETA